MKYQSHLAVVAETFSKGKEIVIREVSNYCDRFGGKAVLHKDALLHWLVNRDYPAAIHCADTLEQ